MKRNGILIMMVFTLVMSACKKEGCTDSTATNYNPDAKKDDGTCIYASAIIAQNLDCQTFDNGGTAYQLVDLGLEIDYIVDCKMPVRCDLKIMPNVTIAFKTGAGLSVYPEGSINVVGTSSSPIKFTGFDAAVGSWAGIMIDSDDTKNKFDHCIVEYAGGSNFNSNGDLGSFILWASSKVDISNTNISKSAAYGINANYSGGAFTFTNNTITTCTKPMFICGEYGGYISGGTYTGNAIDVIYIDTYSGQPISTPQTWTNLGVPYRLKGGSVLISNSDFNIAPGVVMEFEAGSSLRTAEHKSIRAVGTASEKIIFRGVNPGSGAWKNIYYWGTNSLNEIGHAIIIGGGEDPSNTYSSVYLWTNAKLNIHDVDFIDNAACGVYGRLSGGSTANPNYSSSNLTFTNTPCSESFL